MEDKDWQLLREYVKTGSEQAFTEIVSRYTGMVYSVSLRWMTDPHLAQDVTQAVFIVLARDARKIHRKVLLSGWLFNTAKHASLNALKMRQRRQKYESQAGETLYETDEENREWKEIAPLLNEAMAWLGKEDRQAVLLKFFEKKSLKEIGIELGLSEDAARKRIDRALPKLQEYFSKRGVTVSTVALSTLLTSYSVQAAPAGLAVLAANASLAGLGETALVTTSITLAKETLRIMLWQKIKIAAAVCLISSAAVIGVGSFIKNSFLKGSSRATEMISPSASLTSSSKMPLRSLPSLDSLSYTLIDLGTLGGEGSEAQAINSKGQIVGQADTTDGLKHAFLWENNMMKDITPDLLSNSSANDINDQGQVAGSISAPDESYQYAFLWDHGVITNFGTLGGKLSTSNAINSAGQIVGYAKLENGLRHAFLWQNGVMKDLTPSFPNESYAHDINDAGQIVGSMVMPDGTRHDFLWQNDKMIDLGMVGYADLSYKGICRINATGQVSGTTVFKETPFSTASQTNAFIWQNGAATKLMPELPFSFALSMNALGQVVGKARTQDDNRIGFLWQKRAWVSVEELVSTDLVYQFDVLKEINDAGQIAGCAFIGEEKSHHAILLNPSSKR